MGADGEGAVVPSCIDARWGKMSADTLGTSGYAGEFIGEERCRCWVGVFEVTIDCRLSSSSSSRSRLFEAGLAAGTVRSPAVLRSLSRSLTKSRGCLFRHDI